LIILASLVALRIATTRRCAVAAAFPSQKISARRALEQGMTSLEPALRPAAALSIWVHLIIHLVEEGLAVAEAPGGLFARYQLRAAHGRPMIR
jgi:hypothetical protein